ncbi:T9SS type A sorting domain-containing protein [Hymenobacter busanensis]|uniref:T9SS type A sorting domain-containing protein n=1 Tax=Hymenobacter busanensis TaxID=2607656 RepID=A0A7L4ZZX9_9BACT|nr:FG-GAP-like repeat-containing protein [Hymenobacter busanensis]KAA9338728.1 T9SS type A sorting domain-containing protein [Hymenobacter busanensis]QHJ08841.1 T9SS type A sorting domain-containing protein [Hymenobacter busanensis]
MGISLPVRVAGLTSGILAIGQAAVAQPTITSLSPVANANSIGRSAPVQVQFSQLLDPNSAGGLYLHSGMRGGMRSGHSADIAVTGAVLEATPTYGWNPGETVMATASTGVRNQAGQPLQAPRVFQFTAAVGGSGGGNFVAPTVGAELPGTAARDLFAGDVDGDGDLDLVFQNGGVSVRLNNGTGAFGPQIDYPVLYSDPSGDTASLIHMTMGDVDGDGDLDVIGYIYGPTARDIVVYVNDGSGYFAYQDHRASVSRFTTDLTLGDLNGDGALDLVAVSGFPNEVHVRLNNGNGFFTTGSVVFLSGNRSPSRNAVLGDVDQDGDLDMLLTNNDLISVRLNNGNGGFSGGGDYAAGLSPQRLRLGDVDNDGDLDAVASDETGNQVCVRLNNSFGVFGGGSNVSVAATPRDLRLVDVDGDSDLDIVAASPGTDRISTRLNNGSGSFAGGTDVLVGDGPGYLVLADLDGDLDLDAATANELGNSLSVRLNQPASSPPLPVELADFQAERRGASAVLRWSTATETNNRGFAVEVSTDGRTFQQLGWQPGQGSTAGPTQYRFADEGWPHHSQSVVYYRLRQFDFDGTERLSVVRTLQASSSGAGWRVEACPNPFMENLQVQLQLTADGPVSVTLTDALGRVHATLTRKLVVGATTVSLVLPERLPAGLYFLDVQQADARKRLPVMHHY